MNTIGTWCCQRQVKPTPRREVRYGGERARVWELILVGPTVEEAPHVFEGEGA